MRHCKHCDQDLPLSDFYVRRSGRQAGQALAWCKPCYLARHKEYRGSRPGYWKDWLARKGGGSVYARKVRYGITPDDYDRMVEAQGGRCPICLREKKLVVDHCHNRGHVRGLLCGSCNYILGVIENPEWMARAQEYLRATGDPGGLLSNGGLQEPGSGGAAE